jgi:hypothetical protein
MNNHNTHFFLTQFFGEDFGLRSGSSMSRQEVLPLVLDFLFISQINILRYDRE